MAVGALLLGVGDGAVLDVAFQCAGYAVGPCGDGVDVEGEFADKFDDVGDRHAVAEDAGDELGVVPVFFLEHAREALDGDVVAVLVDKLEVVAGVLVAFVFDADDPAFVDPLGQEEALGAAGEDLVGAVFVHADDGNPVLLVVLEADNLGLELLGTFGGFAFAEDGGLLLALAGADEDAGA